MKKGLMIVISGPAGSGKGTVNAHLLKTGEYAFSVSATTRNPRPGEEDGVNYHFISREDFLAHIGAGDMLEYTEYCGNFYGTFRKEADEIMSSGKNLILEIEVEGARNIKKNFPDAVLIMLLPPSFSVQEQRLRNRGTETEEKILARLERTREEIRQADFYDYVVYNRDGCDREAAEEIRAIVTSENCSMRRNGNMLQRYFAD